MTIFLSRLSEKERAQSKSDSFFRSSASNSDAFSAPIVYMEPSSARTTVRFLFRSLISVNSISLSLSRRLRLFIRIAKEQKMKWASCSFCPKTESTKPKSFRHQQQKQPSPGQTTSSRPSISPTTTSSISLMVQPSFRFIIPLSSILPMSASIMIGTA